MIADIANLIARQGEIQADAAARNAAIWGQTISNIGQMVGNYPAEQIAKQEAKQLQQIRQLQLADAQRAAQGQAALASAVKDTPLTNAGGVSLYDIPALSKRLADAGYGDLVPTVAQHFGSVNDGLMQIQNAKMNVARQWAAGVQAAGNDPKFALSHIDGLAKSGAFTNEDIGRWTAAIIQDPTPENIARFTAMLMGPEKNVVVGEGGALVGEQTGRAKFVNPKPAPQPTEAALDAAHDALVAKKLSGQALTPEEQASIDAYNQRKQPAITPYQQEELNLRQQALNLRAGGTAAAGPIDPNAPRGEAFLATLPANEQAIVKSLVEGRQPWPSSFALARPPWNKYVADAFQYDPSLDIAQVNENARAKVRNDFTSGKSAQQINAINTVVGHLGDLADKAANLDNSSYQFVNAVRNKFRTATGSPAVTNFNTAKQAVANELTRVYRQAGGSEADIKEWEQSLNAAASPEQLRGAFKTIGNLLESKLNALQEQYRQGMGTSTISVISPKARAALDKLEGATGPAAATAAPNGQKTIHKFGATYEWDGSKYVRQ